MCIIQLSVFICVSAFCFSQPHPPELYAGELFAQGPQALDGLWVDGVGADANGAGGTWRQDRRHVAVLAVDAAQPGELGAGGAPDASGNAPFRRQRRNPGRKGSVGAEDNGGAEESGERLGWFSAFLRSFCCSVCLRLSMLFSPGRPLKYSIHAPGHPLLPRLLAQRPVPHGAGVGGAGA